MENASKALIMAAGVLIGILVLSLGVFLFVDFGGTAADVHAQADKQRLVQANSKYTIYESTKGSNGDWVNLSTIYDIVTVAGYAKENNNYYKDSNVYNEEYKIEVVMGTKTIQDTNLDELLKSNIKDPLQKFRCSIQYHNNGRVSKLIFV